MKRLLGAIAVVGAITGSSFTSTTRALPGHGAGISSPGHRATPQIQTAPEPSIELVDQSTYVHVGDELTLRVALRGVDPAWTVQLTPHQLTPTDVVDAQGRTSSRVTLDELLAVMAGSRPLGASRRVVTVPVSALPSDERGVATIAVPVATPRSLDSQPRNVEPLDTPVPGGEVGAVYPLEIRLLDPDGRAIGPTEVTFVVVLSRARAVRKGCEPSTEANVVCRQLSVAWLWRMSTPTPAHRPDGSLEPAVRADLTDGGRIACLVELAQTATVPVTIVADPELLEAWDSARQLERSRVEPSASPSGSTGAGTTGTTGTTGTSTTGTSGAATTAAPPAGPVPSSPLTAPPLTSPPTSIDTSNLPPAASTATATPPTQAVPAPPATPSAAPAPAPVPAAPVPCRSGTSLAHLDTFTNLTGPDGEGRYPVLRQPYVPVDLPGLEAANLDGEIGEQLNRGRLALDAALGSRANVDTTTMALDRADVRSLVRLRDSGVTRVVVDPGQLVDVDPVDNVTVGRPTTIAIDADDRIDAAVTNPGIEALLLGDAAAVVRIHRFIAALSFTALERPTESRGVVLLSQWDTEPDPETMQTLLAQLGEHPLIRLRTLSDWFGTVEREQGESALIERELLPVEAAPLVVNGATISETRRVLEDYERWIGPAAAADVVHGRRNVLIAERSGLDLRAAQALLDEAAIPINVLLSQVTFTTEPKLTITGRRAQLGVQFTNDSGRPITVRLELTGPKVRFLDAPDPRQPIELPPGTTVRIFHFEVRASGDSSLRITMSSPPDGGIPLGTSDVRIRSLGFSGLAAWITVAATVFLGVWWATHLQRNHRRRSQRRLPAGPESGPALDASPDANPGTDQPVRS